ncbi:MAG: hypothetical protein ACTSPN_15950 [Promethearchaeota archaeon]
MKQWKRILVMKEEIPLEVVEENEYRISTGCYYFHDQKELNEFDNVNDDALKEA